MNGLLSDHDLWRRLAQLPVGHYGAMLDLCQVSKMTGQKLRNRANYGCSEIVRERLSNGFALLDADRIVFKVMHSKKRGRKKMLAVIKETRPIVQTPPLFYPQALFRELKNDHPHLSLPPVRTRMGRG